MNAEKNDRPEVGEVRKQVSKAALTGFLLSILSILLFFIYWIALIFCLIGLSRIKRSNEQLYGRGLALTGIFIPLILILLFWGTFFFFWFQDAGPVPDDYTVADLVQVKPESEKSYDLLKQFWGDEVDNPVLGLDEADCQVFAELSCGFPEPNSIQASLEKIRKHADSIHVLWDKTAKGREVFEQLFEFDEIADLSEPSLEEEGIYSRNLLYLIRLYQLHSMLIFQEGQHLEAIRDMLEVDAVFRKLSRSSRPYITKLGCYGVLNRNIQYCNLLVNLPEATREDLELLRKLFPPYITEEISLKNNFLYEYLLLKNEMQKYSLPSKFPMFKENSSYRLYKLHVDYMLIRDQEKKKIEAISYSIWPWENPNLLPVTIDLEKENMLPWYYTAYNPIGSMMIQIVATSYIPIFYRKEMVITEMNIFQVLLEKRLEENVNLNQVLEENNARLDIQKGIITIRGLGKEDIRIPIDPEVLGLAESR